MSLHHHRTLSVAVSLFLVTCLCGLPTAFAEEPSPSTPSSQETVAPSTESVSPPETGEVQERGVFENRLEPRIFNPQTITPAPATKIPIPGITAPKPGAALPPDRYQAPTPNLTMVANALRLNHKSLTTLVTLPPNLPVTRPVDIGIIYSSPAGIGQMKQSYAGSTGNRFLYNDREGDGKPRAMEIAITLTEPSAGEAGIYPMKWRANLDPLYDVAMGQFEFTLLNSCDTAGQTEIILAWALPDNQSVTTRGFSTAIIPWKESIPEFRWVGKEIGWSQPLFKEVFRFYDDDPGWVNFLSDCVGPFFAYAKGCGFSVPLADDSHLLNTPNGGMWVERKLKAENDSCKGKYKYFRNKYLLLYPTLQPR